MSKLFRAYHGVIPIQYMFFSLDGVGFTSKINCFIGACVYFIVFSYKPVRFPFIGQLLKTFPFLQTIVKPPKIDFVMNLG